MTRRPPRKALLALGALLALSVAPSAGATGLAAPWLPVPGFVGLRTPHFVNSLSALSWNALQSLTLSTEPGTPPTLTLPPPLPPLLVLNQDPITIPLRPLDGGCSFLNPAGCSNGIYTPNVSISLTFGDLVCNTSVGLSNPTLCEPPGPGAAVPEPSAALVFAVGLAVAAARRRSPA